jgi:peroxiredoxin
MNTTHRRFLVLSTVVLVAACQLTSAGAAAPSPLGKQIADFTLNDSAGAKRSLAEWKDRSVLVVVFLGTECPLAKHYAGRLAEIDAKYADRGVQIIGVNSNQQDTLQELAAYGKKFGAKFPLLKDPGAKVADQFGATRTPEAFVLDRQHVVRYHGRIDDQYSVGSVRNKPTKNDLLDAVDAMLAGKPVAAPLTEAVGCLIGRREPSHAGGDVTYSKDIAPIVQNRCVTCHRTGQIAPFTLTDYADAAAWSDMCLEVIDSGRMPPWGANPKHGEFLNDARLSDAEKELFHQWVEAGVPEGDPADLPPPRQFAEGWSIPKPDVVYKMPEEFKVPATGTVDYQYFIFDPHFTEDKWVYSAEARPGNREVVHHLLLFYIPPGQDKPRDRDPLFNAIAAFAPGMPAIKGDERFAVRIPAGSKLAFQVHYTPNGTPQTDRSEAAVIFSDPAKVKKEVRIAAAFNFKFLIPPGHPDYAVTAEEKFDADTMLYTLTPHMHYRGKSFRFTAEYPDHHREILLDVPRYDFNWQIVYLLKKPKLLPAGTVIHMEGHFDNSANNPLNPDPTQTVYWGDQTWDEMMIGSMTVSQVDQDVQYAPRVEPIRAAKDNDQGEYRVTFRFHPKADDPELPKSIDAVYVAGEFNKWKKTDHRLSGPDGDGVFTTELKLPAGRYEYKFVVNGDVWKADPGSSERTLEYRNSVLHVK